MKDTILLPGGVLGLSATAAQRLTRSGHGDGALLYLQLLQQGTAQVTEETRKLLQWDSQRLEQARVALVSMGLLKDVPCVVTPTAPPPQPEMPPEYTATDITREMELKDSLFPELVGEVQRRLGKILSTSDLKTLFTIYDYLALPAEVILMLVRWCIEEHQRKYGQGQLPRLSIISRQAFQWKRKGIDTVEEAEVFLQRMGRLHSQEGRLLSIVGVTGRNATDRERPYLEGWLDMGFEEEVIRMAYESTLFKKQTMNWPYMNSILKSWHQKGLRTPEDIATKDKRPARTPSGGQPTAPAGDADRRVREDMERMRAFMRQQKEEN